VRILLDYRPALRQRTGVGEYVHELARALMAQDRPASESLTLFSSSWRDRLDPGVVPGATTADVRLPVRAVNYAWHRWQWPTVEHLTGRTYDVVHAAHPIRLPSRTAAQVVTVHDLDFLRHPERTQAEIRRDYPELAPAHIRDADAVIAVSASTAADIETLTGRPTSRVTIAPLGRPDWARRLQEPEDGVLLFFGTLEPRKNIGGLLDAYALLLARRNAAGMPTPTLVLAGAAGHGAGALIARTHQGIFHGKVEVLGYVDPDRRVATYHRALAVVMPSHTEGFGLPALEAMTLGIPVVAAHQGALPEVLGGAGILCDAADPAALSAALESVITNRAQRDHLRDAGWRRAQDFSWGHTAARTREAWAGAIDAARERRRG
jgi:glycosyltransferase involved in cell wall biosynthesis